MDRAAIIERNRAELIRLQTLVTSLSDDQFALSLGDGWTVGSTLAHLAFFDQRALVLLERWESEGVGPSELDLDAVNRAALPQWLALPPRTVADIVLKTAAAVDKKLETISLQVLEGIQALPDPPIALFRAEHRGEHIDQIREALKAG